MWVRGWLTPAVGAVFVGASTVSSFTVTSPTMAARVSREAEAGACESHGQCYQVACGRRARAGWRWWWLTS